jgi:hypothetical protein
MPGDDEVAMKKWPWVCLIALVAEVYAIRWRWEAAPTDQLRVWYEDSFRAFFLESIAPWIISFTLMMGLLLFIARLREKRARR